MKNKKNGGFLLRNFRETDLAALRELIMLTIDGCYVPVYPAAAVRFFKDYHNPSNILNDAVSGYTLILEDQGNPIGTGTLLGANIRRVFIHPGYQHRGLGKLIMNDLEMKAASLGIPQVDLSASLVAKEFYLRLGYSIQKDDFIPLDNDQKLGYYEMVKSLQPSFCKCC